MIRRRRRFPALAAAALLSATTLAAQQSHADADSVIPKAVAPNPDAIAVVIGNRHYKNADIPQVEYALRDAQAVKRYLVTAFGFREENIIYLEDAPKAAFEKVFGSATQPEGQLADYVNVKPGKADVFIFYSGHGAPDTKTGKTYFFPTDGEADYLSLTGYSVDQLYANLGHVQARSFIIAFDACFSGASDKGSLIKGASPALLRSEPPSIKLQNALIFAAAAKNQIASWDTESEHGLFTTYLLRGLQGAADADSNRAISAEELQAYLAENVTMVARRKSREQTPEFVAGKGSIVLTRYDGTSVTLKPLPPANPPVVVAKADAPVTMAGAPVTPVRQHYDPNGTDVKLRIGGRLETAGLYVDGGFKEMVQTLKWISVAPGQLNLSVRSEGCVSWDTTFAALPGDSIVLGYKIPKNCKPVSPGADAARPPR